MKSLLLLFTCFSISSALLFGIKNYRTTARGCVKCYGKPMPYVKIQLKDKDTFHDGTFGSSRADHKGCFTVSGTARDFLNGKPEPYLRIEYQYSGIFGKMEVETPIFGKNRYAKTKSRSYTRYINYGNVNIRTINCKAYRKFYYAMGFYYSRVHTKFPGGVLHIRTGVIISGGTPYATDGSIRIPKGYPVSKMDTELARHESAHIFRHRFDGGYLHFLKDVIKYNYLRRHKCELKTNNGYAFNEGWAEFWAGQCQEKRIPFYGKYLAQFNYEGNVALGLAALKRICRSSYKKMVEVLRRNSGTIHSFWSYNWRHMKLYGCRIQCNYNICRKA